MYPDAPHAFHADYRASYRQGPAEDGWKRAWRGSRRTAWPEHPAAERHRQRAAPAAFPSGPPPLDTSAKIAGMTLIAILLGTLAAGIGSVWLAAALMRLWRERHRRARRAAGSTC